MTWVITVLLDVLLLLLASQNTVYKVSDSRSNAKATLFLDFVIFTFLFNDRLRLCSYFIGGRFLDSDGLVIHLVGFFLCKEDIHDIFLDPRCSTKRKTDSQRHCKSGKIYKRECFGTKLGQVIFVLEIWPMSVTNRQ